MGDTSAPPSPADSPAPLAVRLFATGLFVGYSPLIPGTAGSLLGLAIYPLIMVGGTPVLVAAIAVCFIVGVAASASMEKYYGEDPPIVVIDEIVGMWISLLFLPPSIPLAACAFVLFRIFDTIKPPPARNLESLKHGFGVMTDDVAAGIYANIGAHLILLLFPGLA